MKVININRGKVINLDNFDCVCYQKALLGESWLILAKRKHKGFFGTETIEETIAEFLDPEFATALTNDIANAWATGTHSFNIDKWVDEHISKIKNEVEQEQPNKKEDPLISSIKKCEDILRQHEELSSDLK